MKLDPRQRFLAILFIGALLLFLSYPMAIRRTVEANQTYKELRSKSQISKDLPQRLALYKKKDLYYDSILNQINLGSNSVQNSLIKFINGIDKENSAQILEFNKPHLSQEDNNRVTTYQFKLQGSFQSILKTIYQLEQNGNFGEVVYLDFEKKRNYKTGKDRLEATVFIRQLR